MPLYEYECGQCGARFEFLVRSGSVVSCVSCSSEQVTRLLSQFSVTTPGASEGRLRKARAAYGAAQKDKLIAEREERQRHHH
jgi:putative FmdB family regulatory protein